MVRKPCFDENGIKRGAWSQEEDDKLRAYVENYGHSNWRELPKYAGLARCGKSCRLRWMNYLRPNLRRGDYTEEENELILKLHQQHGNKWSLIAERLPGRTDNEIKNHWHTHLKRRVGESKSPTSQSEQCSCGTIPSEDNMEVNTHLILESSLLSPQLSLNSSTFECAASSSANWIAEDNIGTSSSGYYPEAIDSFWNEPFLVDTSDDQIDPYPYGYCHDDNQDFSYQGFPNI